MKLDGNRGASAENLEAQSLGSATSYFVGLVLIQSSSAQEGIDCLDAPFHDHLHRKLLC